MAPKNASVLTGAAVYEMACNGDINQAAQYIEREEYEEPWHFFTALRVAEIQSNFNRILELSRIVQRFNLAQTANILRADALIGLGRHTEAEAAIEEIKQALFVGTTNNAEVSSKAQRQLAFSKLQLFRLQQDQSGVTDMVKEHKKLLNISTKGDKNIEQTMRLYHTEAFVEVGLKEQAVEELEAYFAAPGSYPFLYVDIHPLLASLKGHPAYEALRERYAKIL